MSTLKHDCKAFTTTLNKAPTKAFKSDFVSGSIAESIQNMGSQYLLLCYKLFRYYEFMLEDGITVRQLADKAKDTDASPESLAIKKVMTDLFITSKSTVQRRIAVGRNIVARWLEEDTDDEIAIDEIHFKNPITLYDHASQIVTDIDAKAKDAKAETPHYDQLNKDLKANKLNPLPANAVVVDVLGSLSDLNAATRVIEPKNLTHKKKTKVLDGLVIRVNNLIDDGKLKISGKHVEVA